MKKVLVLLSLVATVSAFAQGTIRFSNYAIEYSGGLKYSTIKYGINTGSPFTTATKINGGGTTANGQTWGQYAQAALYAGAVGADPSTFVLVVPAVGFKGAADATYAGYWDDSDPSRAIPGVAAGADALVQIRVWDIGAACSTYEAAVASSNPRFLGQSTVLRVTTGGTGSPAGPPAELVNNIDGQPLAAFTLSYVPEPSIIGLGILGAVAGLFVFRRRS